MELLLHYLWKNRIFPWQTMQTTTGQQVEVLNVGCYNTDAGPDFFNAQIKINQQLWVGNIEMHLRSSDWYRHRHEQDAAYNNVVLHVVAMADSEVRTKNGLLLPQMVLPIPDKIAVNYRRLMTAEAFPPCGEQYKSLTKLHFRAWLERLLVERLEEKTQRVEHWYQSTAGDWERCFFILLARAFGFGKNTDVFEQWASTILPQQMGKHRDNVLQMEAFFLGQAGLLNSESVKVERQDSYFLRLQSEYAFLQRKFDLLPLPFSRWKFLRMRPQNFPYRRLVELAHLMSIQALNFSKVVAARTLKELRHLLHIKIEGYWAEHYVFGFPTGDEEREKVQAAVQGKATPKLLQLSTSTKDLLIVNAAVPVLFAYARKHNYTDIEERVLEWLRQLKAEKNSITQAWERVGVKAENAAETQALLQLHQHYCLRKDCLRCAMGTYFLKERGF